MASIVDAFPYPFDQPMAQELVRVMAGLYRTEREAMAATQPFGIDPFEVTPNLAPLNLWWELLGKLAISGSVRGVVQAARDQFPKNPRAPFLTALLAGSQVPTRSEPISASGTPSFDDTVTAPEALLFFDDLTIPVGMVPSFISILTKLINLAPAVCLLRVESSMGTFFGTGFRVGVNRLLTNHHVLFPRGSQPTRVVADFNFDVDSSGVTLPITSLVCDPASVRGEKDDDWAFIDVAGLDDKWPIIFLNKNSSAKVGDLAYILQHPNAQRKRLGFVRNMITEVEAGVMRYLTDTEPGSSGAPVFDAGGNLIALHHAGGRPVEIVGKPPVAKNEGVRITRILERLESLGLQLNGSEAG